MDDVFVSWYVCIVCGLGRLELEFTQPPAFLVCFLLPSMVFFTYPICATYFLDAIFKYLTSTLSLPPTHRHTDNPDDTAVVGDAGDAAPGSRKCEGDAKTRRSSKKRRDSDNCTYDMPARLKLVLGNFSCGRGFAAAVAYEKLKGRTERSGLPHARLRALKK